MATLSGAEYLARAIDAYGVRSVFLVPTILSRTLYELEEHTSVARIVTHGEKAAAYMADGYARATGRPGVCMAQNVGAANLAAGLRDPYLGCSPVVALTGGPYAASLGRNYYQEVDNLPFFRPLTKFSARVPDAGRLPDLLAEAFSTTIAGKPGPAHLECEGHAGDVLEDQVLEAAPPEVRDLCLPPHRPLAEPDAVARAAALLCSSQRPVAVAGGGARASGAGPQLLALAERLGMPIATSLNAKDTIPGDHPLNVGVPGLYSRPSANELLLEADLVCFIGSRTGSQVTLGWQVPPLTAEVVQLDLDPTELGRHYPRTTGLWCDARAGLEQLLAALGDADAKERLPWTERAAELVRRWREAAKPLLSSEDVPIRPERLCGELSEHLPDDALLVADTGHAGMWTAGYVDLRSSEQRYIRAAGSLGWGLPAAIGAQLGRPGQPVVLFTGDGGLWYHLAELETAARWKIPVVVVVNDNHTLNQEIGPYTAAYGGELHGRHAELWHFRDVDLARVAESLGVLGLRVTRPGELAGALAQAFAARGPVLVDVATDIGVVAPPGTAHRADA